MMVDDFALTVSWCYLCRTNAAAAVVFQSRVRDQPTNTPRVGSAKIRFPVFGVHGDYAVNGINELKQEFRDSKLNLVGTSEDKDNFNKLIADESQRFVVIRVWRPVYTILKDPLTVVDWATVVPEVDGHPYQPEGNHPVTLWNWSKKQRWYYLNEHTPEEALVFMQYDDGAKHHKLVPHTAFKHDKHEDKPTRVSVEVSVAAIIPKGVDIQRFISSKFSKQKVASPHSEETLQQAVSHNLTKSSSVQKKRKYPGGTYLAGKGCEPSKKAVKDSQGLEGELTR